MKAAQRGPDRRWCLAPAILREPAETLEGSYILKDLNTGELAGALWSAYRDVTVWASVAPENRDGLFTTTAFEKRMDLLGTCEAPAELKGHLTALAQIVDTPATMEPAGVSALCTAVSQWAADRGMMGTAVAFAQAGALSFSESASAALAVGGLVLRWGRFARAETWLRRAIGLARRAKDWEPYALSYVNLGALYRERGQPEQSYQYYRMAARAGRRHSYSALRGAALHGLFLLHMDKRELEEAARFGKMAVRAYGRGHPSLPQLQHDLAQLWIASERYGRAIPVLQRLLPNRHGPAGRAFTLALVAHAAAATGERRLYEDAWSKAWALLDTLGTDEGTHRTLLELARAAVRFKDWIRVSLASQRQADGSSRARDAWMVEEIATIAAMASRASKQEQPAR